MRNQKTIAQFDKLELSQNLSVRYTKRVHILGYFTRPGNGSILPAAFTAILFLSGSVFYSVPLISNWSLFYLFGAVPWVWLFGFLGYRWSNRNFPRSREQRFVVPNRSRLNSIALKFAFLNVATSIFFFMDKQQNGFTTLFGDMATLRDVTFEMQTVSVFSYFCNLTIPFTLFSFIIGILFYEELSSAIRIFSLGSSLINVIGITVLQAGRIYMITFALTFIWFAFQRRWYGKPMIPSSFILKVCLVLGICGLLAYIPLISVARSSKENQVEASLAAMSPLVTPSNTTLEFIEFTGPIIGVATVELFTYWTSSVVAFDRAFNFYSMPPSYCGGIFPMIERRLASIGLVPDPSEQIRQWVEIAEYSGFYSNMWTTTAFDIIKGFGRSFGLVVLGLMAFWSSWAYGISIRTGSLPLMIFGFLGWLYFFTWFQRSIFIDPIYEYSLYWLLLYCAFQLLDRGRAPASVRDTKWQTKWARF